MTEAAPSAPAAGDYDFSGREDWALMARGQGPDAVHTTWFERPTGEGLEIWCYTERLSYQQDEELPIRVHTTAPEYAIEIVRDGWPRRVVFRRDRIKGRTHQTPPDAFARGCGWPADLSLRIPDDWPSGGYVIRATAERDGSVRRHEHCFVVRPAGGGGSRRILQIVASSTWTAYNDWGGASHYEGVAGPGRDSMSVRLSIERPQARGQAWLPDGSPRVPVTESVPIGWVPRYPALEWAYANGFAKYYAGAGWAHYDRHFAVWAERRGYAVDLISQHDLHFRPELLESYPVLVIVGHDEYWSWQMRDAMEDYVDGGGRVARLAGNYLWQVRLEDEGRTQVCHKYAAHQQDPVMGTDRLHLLTSAWDDPVIGRPGATTMGLTGSRGCYAGFGGWSPRSSGGYTVYRPKSWVFEGTDLYFGDLLGASARVAGFEVDGLDYTIRDGLPYPTGADGVDEEHVEILALSIAGLVEENHGHDGTNLFVGDADARFFAALLHAGDETSAGIEKVAHGCGAVVLYRRGRGEVFNAGSTEWINGLRVEEPMVERITMNVLDRYLDR